MKQSDSEIPQEAGNLQLKPQSLTNKCFSWLENRQSRHVSPEAREMVSLCLMDFFANSAGALNTSAGRSIAQFVSRSGSYPEATQFGVSTDISATLAAFGNAALGHYLIRDDIDVTSGSHFGVIIIPALLAFAQRERLSGKQLFQGILAGYEACSRLGEVMVKFRPALQKHFRPSGIVGAFGVAAGLAVGSNANDVVAETALGFGLDLASGLNQWAWDGSQEIFLQAANAASNGLLAFDLAKSGFKAADYILEGPDGLFAAHGLREGAAEAFENLLDDPSERILSTRFKRVAGCAAIQSPIGAALALRSQGSYLTELVQHIEIRVKPSSKANPGCDYAGTFGTAQQSKMSLQYGVCSALLYGHVDEDTYLQFTDPDLMRLISLSHIVADAGLETGMPQYRSQVTVTMENGQTLVDRLEDAPWLIAAEVQARFINEVRVIAGHAIVDKFLITLHDLADEESDNPLLGLLGKLRSSQLACQR